MALVFLLMVLVVFIGMEKKAPRGKKRPPAIRTKQPCPLCGSRLLAGEKIHTIAYDLGKEKLMHIFGCPFCENPGGTAKRCPVCRKPIPATGFAVGRMWEKTNKTHLHIVGCTECKPRYRTAVGR